jgi:hypothetical protein
MSESQIRDALLEARSIIEELRQEIADLKDPES